MTTRATLIFKLNGKKIATYAQHGDAYRENIQEKVNAMANILFDAEDTFTKSYVMKTIDTMAEAYEWENGAYSWSNYIHEINIDTVDLVIEFKTFKTRLTAKHSFAGTLEQLLNKKYYRDYTTYKIENDSLKIFKHMEMLGYYSETYLNKFGETVYTYSIRVKSKLLETSYTKIMKH